MLTRTTDITADLSPCDHAEADTRGLLHVKEASKSFSRVLFKTIDTDVVIAISYFQVISQINKNLHRTLD